MIIIILALIIFIVPEVLLVLLLLLEFILRLFGKSFDDDGKKWEKTGDIGDNECMWIEATITGCNVNDYKELLIEVLMVDGRTSLGYYKEGVRHCR